MIDSRRQIIPDPLNALALAGGLIAAALRPEISPLESLLDALIRAIVMVSLFFALPRSLPEDPRRRRHGARRREARSRRRSLARLDLLPLVVEIAAFGALAVVLTRPPSRRPLHRDERGLPFGTFLAPAIWICWAIGAWRGDLAAL